MKSPARIVLALYLLTLLWLALFKLSLDIPAVFAVHIRSLNVLPFAGSQGHMREVIGNVVAFIPLGLLLSVNFKRVDMLQKLVFVSMLSLAVETIQFVFAIGVTDITDVITNTFGGLLGLLLYSGGKRYVDGEKLDQFTVTVNVILLALLLFARFFVFRVRY